MLNSLIEKKSLSVNEIENQMAFELPERETLGALIYIGCIACSNVLVVKVDTDVDVNAFCNEIKVINATILAKETNKLTCKWIKT
jgi:hypothetical protein